MGDVGVKIDWRNVDWPNGWHVHEKRDGTLSVQIPPATYPGGQHSPRNPPRRGYHGKGVTP
jgi:hypothetical protein